MGDIRSCIKFKVTTARSAKGSKPALRCVEFQKGKKYPCLPGQKLKGGGRSQNYIRAVESNCSKAAAKSPPKRKSKPVKRKNRKNRRSKR